MLTIDEALELLRDGEQRQCLIADWTWNTSGSGKGSIYIDLVRGNAAEKCLDDASWTVCRDGGLTGFSTRWENTKERTEYSYKPASGESWPLIIHYNFHGLRQGQFDLLEEFRSFHNLWHDRKTDEYFKILDDGSEQKIVYRDLAGAIRVDTVALRKFCAARGLKILLQVDSVQFYDELQEENLEEIVDSTLYVRTYVKNDSSSGKPAVGFLLGKRLIEALPIEKCGIWPYENEKTYQTFIIGTSDDGSDTVFSSDPDQLADYFGKNADNPNYLTPIHFRKEVLNKYLGNSSLYLVVDGYLRCGSKWALRIDNDHEDKVIVFLGDLGCALPESEQLYWRSFNVPPKCGLSETCKKRFFLGQPADGKNLDLAIKAERHKLLRKWREAFGFELYHEFHEYDAGLLTDLRMPISDEWAEFERCTIAANKIFVEYLNESKLAELADIEIVEIKEKNPSTLIRGIDKLQAWFRQNGGDSALGELIVSLRLLQELRSKFAAHRKSKKSTIWLKEKGLEGETPREIYRQLVLEPMLDYCRRLSGFAESRIQASGRGSR